MNQDSKNNRLSDESCAKVTAESEKSPLAVIEEIYKLHVDINTEQGMIATNLAEAETYVESRLARVKSLRHSVSGKQQKLRKLAETCGISLTQLLAKR